MQNPHFTKAQLVLACREINPTMEFFQEELGFKITAIYPADDPSIVELSGHGLALQLSRSPDRDRTRIKLVCEELPSDTDGHMQLTAPNGTVIELTLDQEAIDIPPLVPSFSICRFDERENWIQGRAGMQYRDLILGRLGGRFIASHIRIPGGGIVPDYVHYHKIRFQMIFCFKGWVKVVYEDQGPPFVMRPGDCVLQPPLIRHRVLESSEGLEVIEIGCPAEHHTCVDHSLTLPNKELNPERDFSGQRFVRYQAERAFWQPWRAKGYSARSLGIGPATEGLAGVYVVKPERPSPTRSLSHSGELMFWFVLRGNLSFECDHCRETILNKGDAVSIPAGSHYSISEPSPDLELLEVTMPDLAEGN